MSGQISIGNDIDEFLHDKSISDSRKDSLKSSLKKLQEYCLENDVEYNEINIEEYREWLSSKYTHSTTQSYTNDAKQFVKYDNDSKYASSNKVNGVHNIPEHEVVDLTREHLEYKYDSSHILSEYTIAGKREKGYTGYFADLFVEDSQTAVECKSSTLSEIVKGVSQCIFYKAYNYKAILVTPLYWDKLVDVCRDQGIGLVFADVESDDMVGLVEPS